MSFLELVERRLDEQTHVHLNNRIHKEKRMGIYTVRPPNSATCKVVLKLCKRFSSVLNLLRGLSVDRYMKAVQAVLQK